MTSRYLGNKNTKEFHDLQRQTPKCNISEIVERVYFTSEQQAKRAGYDPCDHCLEGSTR